MKIAVTAVSGQLGSEIVKATVISLGKDSVIGLARTPEKAKNLNNSIIQAIFTKQPEENTSAGIDTSQISNQMHH